MASESEHGTASSSEAFRPTVGMQPPRAGTLARRRLAVRWLKRGVLALIALGAAYGIVWAWLPKPIEVDVGVAARGKLQLFVEEDGRTRVREHYVVSAPLSGTLRRISLEVGDRVRKGEVIATMESPAPVLLDARNRAETEARLAAAIARMRQASAALSRASAAQELAVMEARRARKLGHTVLSASDLDRYLAEERFAIQEHAAAAQQRASAAAEVKAVQATLGTTALENVAAIEVRAPTSGRVLRILQESESPLAMGTPLMVIGDLHALEVVVDVLSKDAVVIERGAEIWVEQWGGPTPLHGHVIRIEPSAFTHISALGVEEQRTNVIAILDDPPASLGDGYRIEARILTWQGLDVVYVPASAVFRHGPQWAVYVADQDRARLRVIEIGHRARHKIEILRGLQTGTSVILYPGDNLRNGVAIRSRAP